MWSLHKARHLYLVGCTTKTFPTFLTDTFVSGVNDQGMITIFLDACIIVVTKQSLLKQEANLPAGRDIACEHYDRSKESIMQEDRLKGSV
jgi:hypothetical protein